MREEFGFIAIIIKLKRIFKEFFSQSIWTKILHRFTIINSVRHTKFYITPAKGLRDINFTNI
ncbi:unnamed protein product, partial [Larinioides sclopetarius]